MNEMYASILHCFFSWCIIISPCALTFSVFRFLLFRDDDDDAVVAINEPVILPSSVMNSIQINGSFYPSPNKKIILILKAHLRWISRWIAEKCKQIAGIHQPQWFFTVFVHFEKKVFFRLLLRATKKKKKRCLSFFSIKWNCNLHRALSITCEFNFRPFLFLLTGILFSPLLCMQPISLHSHFNWWHWKMMLLMCFFFKFFYFLALFLRVVLFRNEWRQLLKEMREEKMKWFRNEKLRIRFWACPFYLLR